MSAEKFCLKWNDFEKNISGSFRELKDDEDFFDVTLTCDSDKQVSAHKVILSACSPFFRQVLRRNKHQHPLLYLRGVSFSDLESVLAFMYNGEVNIAQEQLNSFLAVAEDLRVKGLTQGKDGGKADTERSKSPRHSSSSSSRLERPAMSEPPASKRARHQAANYEEDDEIQEVVPVKSEAGAVALDETKEDIQSFEENYGDFSGYEDQQYEAPGAGGVMAHTQSGLEISKGYPLVKPGDFEQFIVLVEGVDEAKHRCGICNNFSHKWKHNVKMHVEARHFKGYFTYSCDMCGAVTNTMGAMATHKSRNHKK